MTFNLGHSGYDAAAVAAMLARQQKNGLEEKPVWGQVLRHGRICVTLGICSVLNCCGSPLLFLYPFGLRSCGSPITVASRPVDRYGSLRIAGYGSASAVAESAEK